jgi:large subunit GTPase 1
MRRRLVALDLKRLKSLCGSHSDLRIWRTGGCEGLRAAAAEEDESSEEEESEESEDSEDDAPEAAQGSKDAPASVTDEDIRILTVEELEEIFLSHAPANAGEPSR